MTEKIRNQDGLLVAPGPSNLEVHDEKMQLAETDKEDDLLRESDNEEDVGDPKTRETKSRTTVTFLTAERGATAKHCQPKKK